MRLPFCESIIDNYAHWPLTLIGTLFRRNDAAEPIDHSGRRDCSPRLACFPVKSSFRTASDALPNELYSPLRVQFRSARKSDRKFPCKSSRQFDRTNTRDSRTEVRNCLARELKAESAVAKSRHHTRQSTIRVPGGPPNVAAAAAISTTCDALFQAIKPPLVIATADVMLRGDFSTEPTLSVLCARRSVPRIGH